MSYTEKDGQVVLTMRREDWDLLLVYLGFSYGAALSKGPNCPLNPKHILEFMNRLNEGNPNYKPYQVKP